ncbi:serpin family protein [Streptomyces sp. NPDC041068]|uniref:serpin family protein n=1 Tax=Streptomyces sp. NPDC041068 TaxID=3155130 RepID=UPI0034036ED2
MQQQSAPTRTVVEAVNGLTSRWAATFSPDRGTVFSAPGVWPLLAFLADGAGGAARTELADAVGLRADEAAGGARELLARVAAVRGVDAAVGLWTRRTLTLRDAWLDGVPVDALGVLTGDLAADAAALDAWASKHTGGQIERMPAHPDEATEFALASALALRTEWFQPFDEDVMWPETGPWENGDRPLAALRRTTSLLDRVGVARSSAGAVTELKVLGNTGIDVHLLLGEEGMGPGQVLGAGVDALARRLPVVPGPQLPYGDVGPGLTVSKVRAVSPRPPTLHVTTVPFTLTARHDLMERHELFGVTTARDTERGHFPGIAVEPLALQKAEQAATATFGALGFRAAAVTVFTGIAGGMPEERYVTTEVDATFDRPFGFLAVHRTSRLVLAAGWVTDPEPPREDEYDDEDDEDH